jgi:hypothetical protein
MILLRLKLIEESHTICVVVFKIFDIENSDEDIVVNVWSIREYIMKRKWCRNTSQILNDECQNERVSEYSKSCWSKCIVVAIRKHVSKRCDSYDIWNCCSIRKIMSCYLFLKFSESFFISNSWIIHEWSWFWSLNSSSSEWW